MIHIVFQKADVAVLQKAIALDESLQGEIMEVQDDYAVGPIRDIYQAEAAAARRQWWRDLLAGGDYDGAADDGHVNDEKVVEELISKLKSEPDEIVWIWAAQNKHDVSGYYWLMSQLRDWQGRIFILYLNNLPFINEKGLIFYPVNLSEIPAREFVKAKKLARPITLSEFEVDPDEWVRLQNEDKGVRILEGGKKLVQYGYDFYDSDLKKFITGDWQKASRIIHQFLGKNRHTTGDAYLLWRLKTLLQNNEFDVQGELKGRKDFEVKAKSAQASAVAEQQ